MKRPLWVTIVHGLILLNFISGMAYAGFVLFVILAPEGGGGPLWGRAAEVPMELLAKRRLYALEFWVAFSGFAIYLALTELLPRMRANPAAGGSPSTEADE
ncbi:MAG: hypothetical protein JJ863_13005 [Deltaproteobacteria bacterium]|nr:hypothetical protein [Deltaproteobacteria bacterium]